MADPLKKVGSGDKLRIPASTYNLFVDTAQAYLANKNVFQGGENGSPLQSRFVFIKNATGSDVDRFDVLGISNQELDPTKNYFQHTIVLTGVVPVATNHSNGRFVVCAEPIKAGKIGKAYANGHCQVQINVSDAMHTFCDIADATHSMLQSAESGPAVILWKETGAGTKWAIVRFGGSGGGVATPILWAEILEAPIYADPQSFSMSGGRAYYNVRLLDDNTPLWSVSSATHFLLGDFCIDDGSGGDNLKYRSLQGTSPSPNTGHQPHLTVGTWWEKVEDIKIEHAYGTADDDSTDLRLFIPWAEVGDVVELVTRIVDDAPRYYIRQLMTYCGEDADSSLRWNQDEQRAMACYK